MATTQKNKVLFGFSDFYIGTYDEDAEGNVTMGNPYHQPGAVGFAPNDDATKSDFYADNIAYFTTYASGVREGDLVFAMFDDAFKEKFLGYLRLDDGGLAQIKNARKPNVYCAFEIQGDIEPVRIIMYNGSLGSINREYATLEDTQTPVTEALPSTFVGAKKTKITVVSYNPGDAGYETLFTNPPLPVLPEVSE